MITYETHVFPFNKQYKKIIVSDAKLKKIKEFVTELKKKKNVIIQWIIDRILKGIIQVL